MDKQPPTFVQKSGPGQFRTVTTASSPDRRGVERKPAITQVTLNHPKLTRNLCMTRDLSASGVFVLTEEANQLSRGEQLDLTFRVTSDKVVKLHQLTAYVAQVAGDGVGLLLQPKA